MVLCGLTESNWQVIQACLMFFISSDIHLVFYHRFTKQRLAKVIYPRDKILQ